MLGKSDVTSWLRVSRDASGRPSRDASRRSTLQITKPVGLVIVTGVLTVARFVGKVGCYLLVASLSGRLTAFHPPDHKAGGSRHRDGGAHGGEICWESRSLSGRLRASLSGRLTAFHPPDHKAGGSRHRDGGAHGGEICPSRELDDPLASQQLCWARRPCHSLVGPPGAT